LILLLLLLLLLLKGGCRVLLRGHEASRLLVACQSEHTTISCTGPLSSI
jgi:hypothetical protein